MSHELGKLDREIMLDLETLGTTAGCAILTIGACTLDCTQQFYMKVDRQSNKKYNLIEQEATLQWWMAQPPEVREESFDGTTDLQSVLIEFNYWLSNISAKPIIWGNGADFDLPILRAAYIACNVRDIIGYSSSRCYRTLKSLPNIPPAPEFTGTRHNAIDDAVHQAKHAILVLRTLHGVR